MTLSPRSQLLVAAGAGALAATAMIVAAVATELRDLEFDHFTQDPAAVAGTGYSVGVITRVEVMVWSAAAGIALFSGLLALSRSVRAAPPLVALGIVTVVLVADDALLLHEAVTARIDAPLMQVLYAALFVAVVVRFREPLRETPWPLLAAAAGLIGGSALLDRLVDMGTISSTAVNFGEDGLKLAGILIWSVYLVATSRQLLARSPAH